MKVPVAYDINFIISRVQMCLFHLTGRWVCPFFSSKSFLDRILCLVITSVMNALLLLRTACALIRDPLQNGHIYSRADYLNVYEYYNSIISQCPPAGDNYGRVCWPVLGVFDTDSGDTVLHAFMQHRCCA